MSDDCLFPVYSRAEPVFSHGEGSRLFTVEGEEYIDCVGGIATNALGHAHPKLVEALESQARKLWHLSNMFRIPGQEELAAKLVSSTFADRVFFTNSGAEAVECALKTARRYHVARGRPERHVIYGFSGSFHGRSYAAMNAAGNPLHCEGFGPLLPGYNQLSLDDTDRIMAALERPDTAALIVEPVQGEGGAREVSGDLLRQIRMATRETGALLIYDEVQSGMGRTGRLFAHHWHKDIEPDVMAAAKALGCGFPVGACLASEEVGETMVVGTHGSTFGGNPFAMAVGNAAFDIIAGPEFLAQARDTARYIRARLETCAKQHPSVVQEIRGKGLLIGIKLNVPNREFMARARKNKLLVAGGGDNIVRFLPALNISACEAQEALVRFERTCIEFEQELEQAA